MGYGWWQGAAGDKNEEREREGLIESERAARILIEVVSPTTHTLLERFSTTLQLFSPTSTFLLCLVQAKYIGLSRPKVMKQDPFSHSTVLATNDHADPAARRC